MDLCTVCTMENGVQNLSDWRWHSFGFHWFLGITLSYQIMHIFIHYSVKCTHFTELWPAQSKTHLYYSMIYPYLPYCCQIWGATYIYNMDRLHKLQKKAIRIICSENRFAHSGPLMKELGVLNVKNIYNYLAGQFMFRYVNKLLPNVFESYFTLSTSVHTYNTRQQSSFRLPYYRTNLGKRSVRYTGVKIWSEVLKSEIDTNSSQPVFKHNLKRCLLQGIICLDCSKVTT